MTPSDLRPRLAEPTPTIRYSRISWAALLVTALGLAGTLATWHTIGGHERQELRWVTKLAAEAIRMDLTTDTAWQSYGLDRLALMWEAADEQQPLWTENAELYIQHRPGCVAVEWIKADSGKYTIASARGRQSATGLLAFEGVPTSLLEVAARAKRATFSAPVSVPNGSKQWAIAYPVSAEGRLQGFVVSFFDINRSLGHVLEDVARLGFSIELSREGQHVYLLPGSDRQYQREWSETAEVPIPGGAWQIRVWPNPGVLHLVRSGLPDIALVTGTLLSLLLGTVIHLFTITSRQARHVRRINERLTLEVSTRSRAQEDLARAHSGLERRVQERTVELATANELLEHEIEEHKRAEESLREITRRLFRLQDDERRRLARELHDGATQGLVALAMNVQSLRGSATEATMSQTLDESAVLIEQCTGELRTISYLLHPPYFDELGLGPALRSYVEGFSARSGIRINLQVAPALGRLGHDLELAIFRVVQEALANVHRHSLSRTARVTLLRNADSVTLEIVDEGKGIPAELLGRVHAGVAGVGTAGMRERISHFGGSLEITSGEVGTCVRASVPLSKATILA